MIPTAPFGRTGHDSTRVIFGAAGLASMRQERADEVLATLLRHGVNHIDTAASYGDSELRIGPWMARAPAGRSSSPPRPASAPATRARAELERSLERLQVDHVDLDPAPQPGRARRVGDGPRARRRGRGARPGTGRGPGPLHRRHRPRRAHRPHAPAQPRAVPVRLGPASRTATWPCTDDAYRADVEELLGVCAANEVAVQTIKGVARRRWRDDDDRRRFAWYEPLTDDAAIGRAVRWVLGNPQVFLVTTSDATVHGPGARRRRGRPHPAVRRRDAGRRRRPRTWSRCSTAARSSGSDAAVRRPSGRALDRVSGGCASSATPLTASIAVTMPS